MSSRLTPALYTTTVKARVMSTYQPPINRPLEPFRRALIIGGSSGIGAALVNELVQHGYRVAVLARRGDRLDTLCARYNTAEHNPRVIVYPHDVTDFDAVPALFQEIVRNLGGLDLVVYAAAVQVAVAPTEYDFAKDAAMIRVNLLGAIAWLNEAAARFERARAGHIVGISSIAGERGRVGNPVYNTSKAGLNTYLEALRNRLTRHGVTVTTVKPGFVDTRLLANAGKTFWVISPEEAAAQIFRTIELGRQEAYIPARWAFVALIIRHIPSTLFRRMRF